MKQAIYTIKDIENLTGVKAHTLRIWEQRYHLIEPKRTEHNLRYYNGEDLKFMLNVSFLNQNGHKISRIAQMNREELTHLVGTTLGDANSFQHQINALVIAMIDLDAELFEKTLQLNAAQLGFEKTVTQIIYPFLYRVGVLWATDAITPAHEHFISGLIRNKIIVAIDSVNPPKNEFAKKFILYLPASEYHELPLLFAHYIIKSRGHKVFYLGQNLPMKDVFEAQKAQRADYLLSVFTTEPNAEQLNIYIETLAEKLPETNILLTGRQIFKNTELKKAKNVTFLEKVEDLINLAESKSN